MPNNTCHIDKIKSSLNCSPSIWPIFRCLTIINKYSPFVSVLHPHFIADATHQKPYFIALIDVYLPFFFSGLLALLFFFWKVVDKFTRNKWSSPLGQYIILNGVLIPVGSHTQSHARSTICHCVKVETRKKASVKVLVSPDVAAAKMADDGATTTAATAYLFVFCWIQRSSKKRTK